MFERILIPTDGSAAASAAVETALDLAEAHDATVQALYVIEPVYTDAGSNQVTEALTSKGERTVAELGEKARSRDLSATTDVRKGTPHEEILTFADTNDSDVIVMGTHGRTGLGRYLVGSVTQKVVRLADIPVLTVKRPESAAE